MQRDAAPSDVPTSRQAAGLIETATATDRRRKRDALDGDSKGTV
jgi:hypothetical protein